MKFDGLEIDNVQVCIIHTEKPSARGLISMYSTYLYLSQFRSVNSPIRKFLVNFEQYDWFKSSIFIYLFIFHLLTKKNNFKKVAQ